MSRFNVRSKPTATHNKLNKLFRWIATVMSLCECSDRSTVMLSKAHLDDYHRIEATNNYYVLDYLLCRITTEVQ